MYHNAPLSEQQIVARMNEAFTLHQSGSLAEAEDIYRQLLALFPDCWQLLYNLGLLLFESGRLDEAATMYRQALDIHDGDGDLYFNLALCCKQLGCLDEAIERYRQCSAVQPEPIDCYYNLAGCYLAAGRHEEAADAYETVLRYDPFHLSALSNLAYLNHRAGDKEKAIELYKLVLSIRPDSPSAEHMLAALTGAPRSATPADYVRDVFDHYADHYDTSLIDDLHYSVPDSLFTLVKTAADRDRFNSMLDLGCGTGLIGERFRRPAGELHGVDLSPKMLALAERRGIYDALYTAEIGEFLASCTSGPYDLIVAGDVFTYIGNLDRIFSDAAQAAADDGLFFFSIEELQDQRRPLALGPSGRFAHSDRFIRCHAEENGWCIICCERIKLRKERDNWVPGIIYGLKKRRST